MKTVLAVAVLALAGCEMTRDYHADGPDINLDEPDPTQIEIWKKRDPWRADPRRVAHEELGIRVDVPWRGQAYTAERYEFIPKNGEHPDWGSYVVRGWKDHSGRLFRYRVKVGCEDGVWYARQISHFVLATLPNPIFDDDKPPPMGK